MCYSEITTHPIPSGFDHFVPFSLAQESVSPATTTNNSHHIRQVKDLSALGEGGGSNGSSPSLESIGWTLYRESGRFVDTANFALAIPNDRNDALIFPLIIERGEQKDPCSVKLSDGRSLVDCVLDTQTPLLIEDLSRTGILIDTRPICPERPIRSWLSVPIYSQVPNNGKAQGVIVVWSDQPGAFAHRELESLSILGAQAGVVMHNVDLDKSKLASRDQMITAEERARRALARDLHDGPIQLVSAIVMQLDFCRKAWEKSPSLIPEELVHIQELAEHAICQMRTLLFELRPLVLETQGLVPALRAFLELGKKAAKATELTLDVQTFNGEISRQDADVEAVIFAIVCEAVNNTLKHTQASRVEVNLRETRTALTIAITDDGRGFDVAQVRRQCEQQGKLGLVNMWERAELIGGQLDISSKPGQGTCVTIYVPKQDRGR